MSEPTPSSIAADPNGAPISADAGECFALGQSLLKAGSDNLTKEDKDLTKRFAAYVGRFPEEQKGHWFRIAAQHLPSLVETPEYKAWEAPYRAE